MIIQKVTNKNKFNGKKCTSFAQLSLADLFWIKVQEIQQNNL